MDEVNAAGGIQGVNVELVMGDTAGDAAQGVNVAEKFCSDNQIYGVGRSGHERHCRGHPA